MADKTETKKERSADKSAGKSLEKIYTIPLRKAFGKPDRRRANYVVRITRKFLLTHTKAKEVKIGRYLNEMLWSGGDMSVPRNVRVSVLLDGNVAKAELVGKKYEDFKTADKKVKGEGLADKLKARLGAKAIAKQAEEEKIEGKKTGEKVGAQEEIAEKEAVKSEKTVDHKIEKDAKQEINKDKAIK
ncbi:MAG: hypothetical protein ABIG30_00695 [Candidatus Aenigmatarchaeota archaeon]